MIERLAGVIGVIARALARRDDVEGVVDVVVPLRRVMAWLSVLPAPQVMRGIVSVLEDEVHVAALAALPVHRVRELLEDVRGARIDDRMHGIEAQAVEAVFLQPVEGVVNEVITHLVS